jgi:hypothetical protein
VGGHEHRNQLVRGSSPDGRPDLGDLLARIVLGRLDEDLEAVAFGFTHPHVLELQLVVVVVRAKKQSDGTRHESIVARKRQEARVRAASPSLLPGAEMA